MATPPLVSLAEIADYAQVRRPTVSNWRRRHADFPSPVGGSANVPLFDSEEVANWLGRRPIPAIASAPGIIDGLNESANTYGDLFRAGLLLAAITSISDLPPDRLLRRALLLIVGDGDTPPEADPDDRARLALSAAVPPLVEALGTTGAAERLLGAAGRLGVEWAGSETPLAVSALVAELHRSLADGVEGQAVVDLCASTGGMLTALLATGKPNAVTATEPDAALRELLALRLRCHGVADPELIEHSPAVDDTDVVVADPPFQPGEHADRPEHPLLWAERAVAGLSVDGTAYVVVPDWALTNSGHGGSTPPVARSREALLRRRCLRAIVQLPRRIHPSRPGAELVLLVLAAEGSGDGSVVLCDADRVAQRNGRRIRGASGDRAWIGPWVEEIVQAVGAARAGSLTENCRSIPLRELMDRRPLLPSQRLTVQAMPDEHAGTAADARRAAAVALAGTQGPAQLWLNRLEMSERKAPVRYERLGSLLRSGQLRLLQGHRIRAEDLGERGQRVYGREEVLGELPFGRRRIDPLALAEYASAVVTEPGDVVLLFDDRLRAIVDEAGGSVLLAPVQGLRIKAYGELRGPMAAQLGRMASLRIWPHQLAAVLGARRNSRRGRGALVRRADLEGVEVPVLSPQEARLFNEAMAEHAAQLEGLRRQLTALEELGDALASGAADGALSVQLRPFVPAQEHTEAPGQ